MNLAKSFQIEVENEENFMVLFSPKCLKFATLYYPF